MATRVFGPVQGAGTQIRERSGDKPIEPGALGYRGYAAILEKGPVGELIWLGSPDLAKRRIGEYIEDSLAPDCIYDAFNTAAGAGGQLAVRVTDGNEVAAEIMLYARRGLLLTPVGKIKAHNGGTWGGKLKRYSADLSAIGKLANTTLDTEDTTSFKTDEYKGGYVQLAGGTNPEKKYPITGNTAAGVITVAADQTMLDDLNAGTPSDLRYYLVRENEGKAVSIEIRDGDENPDTEFGIYVYVDGDLIDKYPDLSMDPASSRFWENVINNRTSNYEIEAEDLWTGAITADIRPANHYGIIGTVTATVLTALIHDFTINSPTGGDPTFGLGTTTDKMVPQKLTITMTSPTAGDVVSDVFGALGSCTLGTLFDPVNAAGGAVKNKFCPPFTATAGATPLVATDTLVVNYKPFIADELIGGYLYPDKVNSKREKYRIVDNDHKSITVADGSDLTTSGAPADEFLVEARRELAGGRDGNADVTDTHYIQAWDPNTSLFNRIVDRNMGLVKFATPGIYSTAVQKAGAAYAAARNHQYRYEVDPAITTDPEAEAYVNDTLGRSPYVAVTFPSYAWVPDPVGGNEGKLKLTPRTGEIHGREARIAVDNLGYHKAEAGVEATLPSIVKLTTGDRPLDEELLNPRGLAVIKKKQGNYVIWGDRIPSSDPEWKWKHQREQMSYYEHVLQENYDWIIFAIHNPETRQRGLQSLRDFFRKEYRKQALDNDLTFEKAAILKLDREINDDTVKEAGDMIAMVSLKLVGTVERFVIIIGKQGIFESVG
jgi:hypothetical protein